LTIPVLDTGIWKL